MYSYAYMIDMIDGLRSVPSRVKPNFCSLYYSELRADFSRVHRASCANVAMSCQLSQQTTVCVHQSVLSSSWFTTHPPLQLPFVLLLHLQLVVELLLQSLLGELYLSDGSLILQSPLSSCSIDMFTIITQVVLPCFYIVTYFFGVFLLILKNISWKLCISFESIDINWQ